VSDHPELGTLSWHGAAPPFDAFPVRALEVDELAVILSLTPRQRDTLVSASASGLIVAVRNPPVLPGSRG
jgi:hypothetical protein